MSSTLKGQLGNMHFNKGSRETSMEYLMGEHLQAGPAIRMSEEETKDTSQEH